jgi:predicted porin
MPMASGNFVAMSGNTHVGLRSSSLGRIFVGRQDVHYGNTESDLSALAGDLRADSISLQAYMRDGSTAIAGATRTPNIIHYTTPNFSGFTAIVAYSTGPAGSATGQATATGVVGANGQADLISGIRKGSAFHVNPNYAASNFQVGYSYWNSKPDGGGATLGSGDQRSDKIYGSFKIAGFKIGLAWDKSRVKASVAGAGLAGVTGTGGVVGGAFASGTEIGSRTSWSLPISYIMGNNQFHFHYTKNRDDKATNVQDGAKMVALSYQYTLSKRTSVGLTYAKITNDVGAAYNFFTGASLGNSNSNVLAGEDPRLLAATIRHAF